MKPEPHTKSRDLVANNEHTNLMEASSAWADEIHTAAMLLIQCGFKLHQVQTLRRRQIVLAEARLSCGLSDTNAEPCGPGG